MNTWLFISGEVVNLSQSEPIGTKKPLNLSEITLEDVEVAVSIIKHFISQMEQTKSVLRRLNLVVGGQSGYGSGLGGFASLGIRNMDDLANLCLAVKRKEKGLPTGLQPQEEVGELAPEEIEKMKKLVKKARGEPTE